MRTEQTVGEELVSSRDDVHVTPDGGAAAVPIETLDLASRDDINVCNHVYEFDGTRLYALEPHPRSGYWTACPRCGTLLGQRNLGSVPPEMQWR